MTTDNWGGEAVMARATCSHGCGRCAGRSGKEQRGERQRGKKSEGVGVVITVHRDGAP